MKIKKFISPLVWALVFAALFGLSSMVVDIEDWPRWTFMSLLGFFIGLIVAAEFEPKAFKRPALVQVFCGGIVGTVLGIIFHLKIEQVVLACIAGAFLGWLAPYWIKHIQIP